MAGKPSGGVIGGSAITSYRRGESGIFSKFGIFGKRVRILTFEVAVTASFLPRFRIPEGPAILNPNDSGFECARAAPA
jgi:hypothetical protein